MTGALKYEWVRIRTIASSYWMSAFAILLSASVSVLIALFSSSSDVQQITGFQFTSWVLTAGATFSGIPVLAAAFFAVMGAMAMGHEYRYGTNKATLTALPDRVAVFTAKSAVLVAWVTASVIVLVLLNLGIAAVLMNHPQFSSDALRPLVNYWGYCVGLSMAGLSLAAIFRNQTGAIVAALVWPYVLEPIVYGVLTALGEASHIDLTVWTNILPFSAGRRAIFDPYELMAGFGGVVQTWGIAASVVVFWIGVALVVAGGVASFLLRDA